MRGFPLPKGYLVRHFRKTAGLSQEQLAELAGVNVMTVRRLETGSSSTSYLTIMLIAQALQVEPVNFYDWEELQAFMAGRLDHGPETAFDAADSSPEPVVPDKALCRRLYLVPKLFVGCRYRFAFKNSEHWDTADATETEHLSLDSGSCIKTYSALLGEKREKLESFALYANGDVALALLDMNPLVEVEVNASYVYSVIPDSVANFASHPSDPKEFQHVRGFAIDEIVRVGGS